MLLSFLAVASRFLYNPRILINYSKLVLLSLSLSHSWFFNFFSSNHPSSFVMFLVRIWSLNWLIYMDELFATFLERFLGDKCVFIYRWAAQKLLKESGKNDCLRLQGRIYFCVLNWQKSFDLDLKIWENLIRSVKIYVWDCNDRWSKFGSVYRKLYNEINQGR